MESLKNKRKSDSNKPMDFVVPALLKHDRINKASSPVKALNDYFVSNSKICIENGNMFESHFSNNQFKNSQTNKGNSSVDFYNPSDSSYKKDKSLRKSFQDEESVAVKDTLNFDIEDVNYKNTFKVAPGLLDFRDNTDAIGLTKFTILDKYNHSKRSHQKSLNKQNFILAQSDIIPEKVNLNDANKSDMDHFQLHHRIQDRKRKKGRPQTGIPRSKILQRKSTKYTKDNECKGNKDEQSIMNQDINSSFELISKKCRFEDECTINKTQNTDLKGILKKRPMTGKERPSIQNNLVFKRCSSFAYQVGGNINSKFTQRNGSLALGQNSFYSSSSFNKKSNIKHHNYDKIARFNPPIEESIKSNINGGVFDNSSSTLLLAKNQTNALASRLISSYKLYN